MKSKRPIIKVFRSNKYLYAQIVDLQGKTILTVSDRELKEKSRLIRAQETGKLLAKQALEKKIKVVSFDRRSYQYHGRVKALAEGAREGGLEF
jgi:large subunit ribosomal protein L18